MKLLFALLLAACQPFGTSTISSLPVPVPSATSFAAGGTSPLVGSTFPVILKLHNAFPYSISVFEIDPKGSCEVFGLRHPDNVQSTTVQTLAGNPWLPCNGGRPVLIETFANYPVFGAIAYTCGLKITMRWHRHFHLWHPVHHKPGLTFCSYENGVFTYDASVR